MALSPDQRAMLQLLLERGQDYAALSDLLGVEPEQVRERARAALAELGGADPDRRVGLTDYLLGQADPIDRADAVRHLRDDAEDQRLASAIIAALRERYPAAELPRLPGEPRPPRRARRPAKPVAEPPGEGLSPQRTRAIVALATGAVLLVAVVLALSGAFGGGDGEDGTAATTTATETAAPGEEIERVALRPVGGGNAEGTAAFGLATEDQPYIDVEIAGLDAAPQGQTYVVWLMLAEDKGYPLSPIAVDDQGSFADRFAIPSAVLPVIGRVRQVEVAIAADDVIAGIVRRALREGSLVLERPGRTVLRGAIPATQSARG